MHRRKKTKREGEGKGKIGRFFFGTARSVEQRLTGFGVGLLVLMLAVSALICLHFGEGIAAVRADSEEQTEAASFVSGSDSGSDSDSGSGSDSDSGSGSDSDSGSDSEPHYGHLFIDTDAEGVFDKQDDAEGTVDLCHQSLEIYPDESEKDTSVTLYGMMPEGATAEAVDVTHKYPQADDVSSETAEDATVVAAYNITINDGDCEFQPTEARPIRVEIASPQIVTKGITEVWHIKDDGTREQITDFKISEGVISFFATGFSVYAIVNGPEPYIAEGNDRVSSVSDLTGNRAAWGFYLFYEDSNGEHFFQNSINNYGALRETTSISSAAVYFFEPVGDTYRIYTYDGNAKKYLHNSTEIQLELVTDASDTFAVTPATKENAFYLKKSDEDKWLQHSGSGRGIRYYGDHANANNSNIFMYFVNSSGTMPDDHYGLDGKSYGLMHYLTGVEGDALMADENNNCLAMMSLLVRSDTQTNTLFVAENCDITMWTFHSVRNDLYKLSAEVNGVTKYLKIGNTITLTDEANASEIIVTPKDGKVILSNGNRIIAYSENGFIAEADASGKSSQWLYLTEKSGLSQDDYVTYSADKISVSDAPDGASVILYTRIWNDEHKQYEFFAVDYDGTLYPCFERGNNIMWVGNQINSLLWTLIEYHYDDGSPNFYYELYNPYSRKFIAPQIKDNQILSDKKIGINLPGRKEQQSHTTIVAWDAGYYTYSSVMVDEENSRIVSDSHEEASTFYFAMMNVPLKTLTKVSTVDNNEYGITMKLIDYPEPSLQNAVLGNKGNTRGLASTDLKSNGYPVATKTNSSLSELFSSATPVNHLFLKSIYEDSGYFEYDSCQNFATLVNEEGVVGSNFTVYKELGTTDIFARTTLKHGQFFPYDVITPGVYSNKNPENIYGVDADPYDETVGLLPESDPRKYEKLLTVGTAPNYYNGMELSASFMQPPNGKDDWGHDIIFEFRGDDDFWLYVDDELVIDLGGIHSALAGKVNFSTGDVVVEGRSTNLREVFRSNYLKRNPSATEEQIAAFLGKYFSGDEVIFKDYSAHTMKIFYMERGASASNLHLRFNLRYITPGHVLLTKKVTGSTDIDYHVMEFPYQIWYKDEENGAEHLLHSDHEHINVTYQYSTEQVDYAENYTPPNSPNSYEAVYFLNPGKSAEIHFPANTIEYRVIECGVNTEVYDHVYVNGEEITGESIGNTNRKLFDSGWLQVQERPSILFENHVDPNAIRTLSIWKRLYDAEGNLISSEQDETRFSYRVYLSNGSDDVLKLANMRKYHVRDPLGDYCTWDAENQSFVSTGKDELALLTESEKKAATFKTSMNGSISMIPAGYDVSIPGLPVGTRFRVVERDYEIPLGYSLIGYERQGTTYILDDEDDQSTGWVRANESPNMYINNRRGFEIQAEKVWSDDSFVQSHSPIFTAVYVDGALLEGSVRRISSPDTSVRYYYDTLLEGKTLNDYEIREVAVENPVVRTNGVVVGYSSLTPVSEGGRITVKSVRKDSDQEEENEYFVEYTPGTPQTSAPDVPTPGNIRSDLIENNRSAGIRITLYDMNTKEPLANGKFRITHGEDGLLGTFTSDANGKITVLYDIKYDEEYTVTQIHAPESYIGLPAPAVFVIGLNEETHTADVSGVEEKWATGRGVPHSASGTSPSGSASPSGKTNSGGTQRTFWGSTRGTSEPPIIAYVDLFNKPYTLLARKVSSRENTPLAGAHFALYRDVAVIGGYEKDFNPMTGFEDLVTGNDGVIPKIDNTLDPGKYYLTELTPPAGHEGLSGDIVFTVGDNGQVTMNSTEYIDMLYESPSELESAYFIDVRNELIPAFSQLMLTKTVTGAMGNIEQDFTFTLTVDGASASESYEWSKNGEAQPSPLHSGDAFTLRHGENVVITLPNYFNVTVTEANEDYTTTFQPDGGEAQEGNSLTLQLTEDKTVDVTNRRDVILPTGVKIGLFWSAAALVISLAGVACLLLLRRRGKDSSEAADK